jgi:ABC-type antimicrobial peptide transport system permease subunit
MIQHGKRVFYEENGITADASLFSIFSFPLVQGDVDSAFAAPDAIILSSSMSKKYFGNEDPIGRTLLVEGQIPLKVTGIMKDIPRRSHLRFDYVVPFKFVEVHHFWGLGWGDFNFMTYIQTGPQRKETELIRKLNQVALAHKCPQILYKMTAFSLQNLHDIYLNPIGPYDIPLGSKTRVYLFSLIALFIALIAAFNFINLSTARAEKRTKEIGMRKVIGAERRQIIAQFFGESLVITILSLPIALLLARIAMPHFNELTGKEFSMGVFSHEILLAATGITCFVGLLAGAFPALYLSAIQPVHAIRESLPFPLFARNHMVGWVKRGTLRRILVTSQFIISITLILATLVVDSQLRLIRKKSWHLERDLIVTVPIKENIPGKYDLFRNELLKNPVITNVAAKDSPPSAMKNHTGDVNWDGKTEDQKTTLVGESRIDVNYFSTLGMEMVSGRDFSSDFPGDKDASYILNEQAVNLAGLKAPVGKTFSLYGKRGTIVGIIKNTVFQTLRQELQPQVFHLFNNFKEESPHGTVLIRLKNGRNGLPLSPVIAHIRRVWNGINMNTPFEYQFLDRQIEAQYGNEQRLGKLFGTFALLTIFISCMGLIGLVSFVAEQRTKEIGIRKVLGASVPDILVLLNMGLVKQVVLASLLAGPLAYFFLSKWLQGFIYRISLGPGLIVFSGTLLLLATILTGGFQAVRAARMNPTKSLHCN